MSQSRATARKTASVKSSATQNSGKIRRWRQRCVRRSCHVLLGFSKAPRDMCDSHASDSLAGRLDDRPLPYAARCALHQARTHVVSPPKADRHRNPCPSMLAADRNLQSLPLLPLSPARKIQYPPRVASQFRTRHCPGSDAHSNAPDSNPPGRLRALSMILSIRKMWAYLTS